MVIEDNPFTGRCVWRMGRVDYMAIVDRGRFVLGAFLGEALVGFWHRPVGCA